MKQPKKCSFEVDPGSIGKAILVDIGELYRLPFPNKLCKIPQTIFLYLCNSLWIHKSRKKFIPLLLLYFIFIADTSMKITFW